MLQHLVLFVAMAGGAIAARENRLLSLSTFTAFLKGPWATAARSFSASVSVFVTFAIGIGCYQFINTGGIGDEVLFFGIPVWVFMAVMPAGFALLGLRIIWFSGPSWYLRLIPVVAGVVLYFFCTHSFEDVEGFVWPMIALLVLATIAGATTLRSNRRYGLDHELGLERLFPRRESRDNDPNPVPNALWFY